MPQVDMFDFINFILGAFRSPRLAARMARRIKQMYKINRIYKKYPPKVDIEKLKKWSLKVAKLFGEKAEIQ
jgi:hypothetical protein